MMFSVFNEKGIRFNVVMDYSKDDPIVCFYDDRYPHTEYGQFVSSYYASTLLGEGRYAHGQPINEPGRSGLNLDGGIDDWCIDSSACEQTVRFIRHEIAQRSQ